jgi:hypothetical protein
LEAIRLGGPAYTVGMTDPILRLLLSASGKLEGDKAEKLEY